MPHIPTIWSHQEAQQVAELAANPSLPSTERCIVCLMSMYSYLKASLLAYSSVERIGLSPFGSKAVPRTQRSKLNRSQASPRRSLTMPNISSIMSSLNFHMHRIICEPWNTDANAMTQEQGETCSISNTLLGNADDMVHGSHFEVTRVTMSLWQFESQHHHH